ncbi:unnamed protein product [Linum tenue]|uniref:histidine kinase n=1 Tax=Linum tenue TaxID=586396 RepID=A0AAV0HE90_9ROSI|nr:unnamed protein product [Linum tenue]
MPVDCKLSIFRTSLPAHWKMGKQNESSFHGLHSEWKSWRKLLVLLCILGGLAVGSIRFPLNFDGKDRVSDSCEGELVRHFNVSKSQLHALASLYSDSEKIASLECTKELGPGPSTTDRISCAMKLMCSKKQELMDEDETALQNSISDASSALVSMLVDNTLQTSASVVYAYASGMMERCWWMQASKEFPSVVYGYVFGTMKRCWWILAGVGCLCLSVNLIPLTTWWKKQFLTVFFCGGIALSFYTFWSGSREFHSRREETLASMCDERARMLQDQFNVSMNHVHALAILVSTFHHGKNPSAIDQKTFGEYAERTSFERPLTSGVAYALKVVHAEREQFEKQHGWRIKKMESDDQALVQDCIPEKLDPAPVQDEYAPVIFSQESVAHIVSIDMMSGKEDRENILRARASGKGVLTSPFKLLKSNNLGVVLTFAVYNVPLSPHATSEQRIEATVGYLGASYDVPSLVEKLLHQLASRQTIVVNVYDTTNASAPILMYGTDVAEDMSLFRASNLDFGDPMRKHEMHCRFKQKPPEPTSAIDSSTVILAIVLLVSYICNAAINKIEKVEEEFREMTQLKVRAEAADVAKSQFLATVSHEIRTPMNGVLGMLQMLMDTELNDKQIDYAETAHRSGTELISLINEVLDHAKIESGRLELEAVPFELRPVLDNVFSLFSGKSSEKGIEKLAIYVSDQVPQVVIGDPGRFRQIITNLVGNSVKFTRDKGHIFVSVHLADEVTISPVEVQDPVLKLSFGLAQDTSSKPYNTLSGSLVVNRWKSWEHFKILDRVDIGDSSTIRLLVTVEDTGVGIPVDAQSRIFTPFMQADSSTSRMYGGTGIGLSISKRLVDLMGGEIGFVSECDVGSTFSFTVCLRKGELSSLDAKGQRCDATPVEFRGSKALVIDQKCIRAEVTRYHLERLGISVHIASTLKAACCFLSGGITSGASAPVGLSMILIDKDVWDEEKDVAVHRFLRDPSGNGIVEFEADLPKIILLATAIAPDERHELKLAGLIDDVLMKPLRLGGLMVCLQEALGSGKKSRVRKKKPTNLQNLLRGKHILVVDDNVVNRRVAQGALERYGAIVTCVCSGRAAVELLEPPHKFDACFMDRHMPEMDGFEATRHIRARETRINEQLASGEVSIEKYGNKPCWHTPIMAITADVIQATSEECRKCGMDDFVAKPFKEEQLYNAVARFFESSGQSG